MNRLSQATVSLILILGIPLLIWASSTAGKSEADIFQWVLRELGTESDYSMPEFQFVSKARLQELFKKDNKKSFQMWADQVGNDQAEKMMKMYLRELIGLYSPATEKVYVGDFLDPSRREAVLAHEFVHHIQVKEEGEIDRSLYNAEYSVLFREMEAKGIEKKYLETFYPEP